MKRKRLPICQIKRCEHSASAHIRQTMGRFTGQLGRCSYNRCGCLGYVPKDFKPTGDEAAKLDEIRKTAIVAQQS